MASPEVLLRKNVAESSIKEVLQQEEKRLEQLQTFGKEYNQLADVLATLPGKTNHQVMVPFGSLAFMPGRLIHTNEILVHLGDSYYAERSSSQALETLDRRASIVRESIEAAEAQVELLRARQKAATAVAPAAAAPVLTTPEGTVHRVQGESGEQFMEIVEPFNEDLHERSEGRGSSAPPSGQPAAAPDDPGRAAETADPGFDEAMARLEALELEEEEEDRSTDSDDEEEPFEPVLLDPPIAHAEPPTVENAPPTVPEGSATGTPKPLPSNIRGGGGASEGAEGAPAEGGASE
eukprot:CAMPEP_0118929736 /NCGR_PEP_ID=MMETSP1169-20130426/6652_1 /TAXON_ID=36882 /ORGANISM="Pyramimonas obovata, Strain CCMP722" /LENGTH=292 /DNA_ID=CAMNT_0006871985 /DNA_START=283 /DNA_END=1158 /DNA_ORIENTATION=+